MCAAAAACGCPIWREACNARAKREGAMMSTTLTFTPMLGAYLDPSAIAIVVGGTAIGTVLRTPRRDLARALAALRVLFRRRFDATALVAQVASLGRIAQRHGVIALDRSVIRDPDVAVAVAAIVDGAGPDALDAPRRAAARTS